MDNPNLIGLPARGEFGSYNNRFFYGTVAKVLDKDITIKGIIGKRKKIKYYTFSKDKVQIYKN